MKYLFKDVYVACLSQDSSVGFIDKGHILCSWTNDGKIYDLLNKKIYKQSLYMKHNQSTNETYVGPVRATYVYNANEYLAGHNYMFSYNALLNLAVQLIERGLKIALPEEYTYLLPPSETNGNPKIKK